MALISVKEAVKRLSETHPGLSPQTVRQAIKDGRLTGEKLGRDWFIEEESLAGFVRRGPWARFYTEEA